MTEVTLYSVVRDQGYGRVTSRSCETQAAAEAMMKEWQREGIDGRTHPSIINGGDWSIQAVIYERREDGSMFFDRLAA